MYQRILDIRKIVERKSLFVFGPRQTGKSTYLKSLFPSALYIDLLSTKTLQQYMAKPDLFYKQISYVAAKKRNEPSIVVIDEIQKLPILLDEVHRLIEAHKNLRFVLTGSSARKLKNESVNLLGGRASRINFNSLVSCEIGYDDFSKNLQRILTFGSLPSIYCSTDPYLDLKDYVGLYIKEEIQFEGLVRKLHNFSRFLEFAALTNGQVLNFTALSSDAEIPARTIREYYYLLVDTLIGNLLPAFERTKKRKAIATAKFYFFDTGVVQSLLGRTSLDPKTPEYGIALEQKIFCELKAFNDYHGSPFGMYYWRSTSQYEVDFILESNDKKLIAIEVKSNAHPKVRDFRGMKALEEDVKLHRKIVVCQTERSYREGDVDILSVKDFLQELWEGKIL